MKTAKLAGNKLVRFVYAVFAAVSLLLLLLNVLSFIGWVYESHTAFSSVTLFGLTELLFVVFVIVLFRTNLVMSIKNRLLFSSVLLLISLCTKALFVVGINTPQYSDFALLYDTTLEIAEGSRDYLQLPYYRLWSYQTAFPAFMSGIVKLFGNNLTALLLINCVFASASNVLVYYISRLKTSEKSARIAAIIYMIFPYVIGLSSVYTNQHLATFLFYLGIYVLFRFKRSILVAPIIAGVLLALGNSIRPEAILFIVAIVGYMVFIVLGAVVPARRKARLSCKVPADENSVPSGYALTEKIDDVAADLSRDKFGSAIDNNKGKKQKEEEIKRILLPLFITVVSYFICFNIISHLFVVSGLNPNGLTNNFPLYKFVVGLNHETNGSYSNDDVRTLLSSDEIKSVEQRDENAGEMIRERLSAPILSHARLVKNKLLITWSARWLYPAFYEVPDRSLFEVGSFSVAVGRINTLFTLIDYLIYSLFFVIMFVSSLLIAAGKRKPIALFFTMLFAASFVAFLIIEVQYRYAYVAMPCIFIWCACAMCESNLDNNCIR